MAKIFDLKIKNFKGINEFHHTFGKKNFICLIGRGDSGKTSILEAISLVLSPKWNIPFIDTDFHNCNIENEIVIEATIYDVPKKLLSESKFGLHIVGINFTTNKVENELQEEHMEALIIRLSVDKTLEPKWYIINGRDEQIEINSSDRALFKMFFISDYLDKHFSWNTGSPLYSIFKNQDDTEEMDSSIILNSLRQAKEKIDKEGFTVFSNVIDRIKSTSRDLGLNIDDLSTTVDFREFMLKEDKVSLHSHNVPFRLKGKGTKRLLSIAIQLELIKSGGIILIDEIEQGLEPDRAQHLAKMLRDNKDGQIFITTHSRDVLVELDYDNLFMIKNSASDLVEFDLKLQGCLRKNPEAFFSNKVLICEGITEIGFCRAINDFRMKNNLKNLSMLGIRLADGTGNRLVEYANGFVKAKYKTAVFCDSDDVKSLNLKKSELLENGVKIIDCANLNCLEEQIFNDLPWEGIIELVNLKLEDIGLEEFMQSINSKLPNTLEEDWLKNDSELVRKALGIISKKNSWFKNIDGGETLGAVCLKYLDSMKDKIIKKEIDLLMEWIDHD